MNSLSPLSLSSCMDSRNTHNSKGSADNRALFAGVGPICKRVATTTTLLHSDRHQSNRRLQPVVSLLRSVSASGRVFFGRNVLARVLANRARSGCFDCLCGTTCGDSYCFPERAKKYLCEFGELVPAGFGEHQEISRAKISLNSWLRTKSCQAVACKLSGIVWARHIYNNIK